MVVAHGATSTNLFSGATSKGRNLGNCTVLCRCIYVYIMNNNIDSELFITEGTVSESEGVKRMMYHLIQHEIGVCQWSALRSGRDVGQIYVSSLISCTVMQGRQLPLQTSFQNWRWQRKRVLSTQLRWSATKALAENGTYYRASGPFGPFSIRLYLNSLQD